jgi:hypothetical protein
MATSTEKLTGRMRQAINALLLHPKIGDAARECGVPERTVYGWMKKPHFTAALAAARRRVVDVTVARVQQASGAALSALLRILADPAAASTAKVQAAKAVLEIAIRERPAGIHVPAANSAAEIAKALEAVSRAVARGDLLPPEAQAIASVFKSQLDAVVVADWERRLATLEEHSRAGGGRDDDEEAE